MLKLGQVSIHTYHTIGFSMFAPYKYPPHCWCTIPSGVPGTHKDPARVAKRQGVCAFVIFSCTDAEHFCQLPGIFSYQVAPLPPLGLPDSHATHPASFCQLTLMKIWLILHLYLMKIHLKCTIFGGCIMS